MPLTIRQNRAHFGIELPLAEFEALALAHLKEYPDTPAVEERGRILVQQDFRDADVRGFVRAVCEWGGYPGISGRILKRNAPDAIRSSLKRASDQLAARPPNFATALAEVSTLNGLGTPSFASKHLRFLWPALCPVFDSLLREALPYSFDPQGYAMFAEDCKTLAQALTQAKVRNPREREWLAADVEAALYAYVTGLDQIQS